MRGHQVMASWVTGLVILNVLPVAAQPAVNPADTVRVAALLGAAVNSSQVRQSATHDLSTRLELPVGSRFRVHVEAGRASWEISPSSPAGVPIQAWEASTDGSPAWRPVPLDPVTPSFPEVVSPPSRLTLRRVVLTTIRTDPTGHLYGGFGIGAYLQTSDDLPELRAWRLGAHGTAGAEIPLPVPRLRLALEGQFHLPGLFSGVTPGSVPTPFVTLGVSMGVKIRM